MPKRTKGQIEAEISKAMARFQQDYFGRGPVEVKSRIIDDSIVVRLKGVLTSAELQLTKDQEGIALVKGMRARLLESARPALKETIAEIAGSAVVSLHADISTKTGERVIVFTLENDLQKMIESRDGE